MIPLSSWGGISRSPHELIVLNDPGFVAETIARRNPGLARGMARSYGDACLNPGGLVWSTPRMDRFIEFDSTTGRLTCEAGALLLDVQNVFAPQGWSLPVTPGTQMVTIGGAIANDVHGKNHRRMGSFGNHVLGLRLARTDGSAIDCGPARHPELFAATIGGIGLTGVITQAEIQLDPIPGEYLQTETIPFHDLGAFFAIDHASATDWEHTAAWIDCLSPTVRGIFKRANWTRLEGAPVRKRRGLATPLTPPVSLVNPLSLKIFNSLYFRHQARRSGPAVVHYRPFFYPLDRIRGWSRMYGPKGFFQYQSVVPHKNGLDATRAMLKSVAQTGEGSFLAVLKTFGERQPVGMLSFPQPGVTLALDFPNRGSRTLALFERLDAIVREAQGRLYLAKDARMSRDFFEASFPRLAEFRAFRDDGVTSAMSRRLMGS